MCLLIHKVVYPYPRLQSSPSNQDTWNTDTSINKTVVAAPKTMLVYFSTPGMRTPL